MNKPIIAYSIEAALNSELFDEVMVSAVNNEISEVTLKYGANVTYLRSNKYSDDYSTAMEVINEVISEYRIKINVDFENRYNKLISNDYTTVFSAVVFSYHI